jgi:branched-chain amino acid transport system substrate-binding protein
MLGKVRSSAGFAACAVSATLIVAAAVSASASGASERPAAAVTAHAAKRASGQVTLGAIMSLTGPNASYGLSYRRGLELAEAQINAAGGIDGKPLKIIEEDTGGDTATGVTEFNELAASDHVTGIITSSSAVTLAQIPLINRYKIPTINAAAETPLIQGKSKYLFSDVNDSNQESNAVVQYLVNKLHIHSADIVWVDDATGQAGDASLAAAAAHYGVKIINSISHPLNANDFTTVVAQLKQDNPPAVLLASHVDSVGFLLKQAAAEGFHPRWLSLSPSVSQETVHIAGDGPVSGVYTVRSTFDVAQNQTGPAKSFVKAFEMRYHQAPDDYSAPFYDAVYLFKLAIDKTGETSATAIRNALAGLNGSTKAKVYQGATGPIAFNSLGVVRQPEYILKFNGHGQLVEVS